MPATTPGPVDKPNLRDKLITQGVPEEEMQKLYRSLRGKGYGEEEARRRSRAALARMKEDRAAAAARAAARRGDPVTRESPDAGGPAAAPEAGGEARAESPRARRVVDWIPPLAPGLRRRINRWAFRNAFAITGFAEILDDLASLFNPAQPDRASLAFLRLLADERGWRGKNPLRLSFIDCLDALRESARRLLGAHPGAEGAEAIRALKAREPFAVEYFSAFARPQDMLRRGLEYLGTAYRARRRVPIAELSRVVHDGMRLIVATERIERERLEALIESAREVHGGGSRRAADSFAEAEALFRACVQALGTFRHEMYPAVLKMIGAFFAEDDRDPRRREMLLAFLGLREEDVLTWAGWQARLAAQREKEQREARQREIERVEAEKEASIGVRFQATLGLLASLFPGSGIERMEQGAFVVPYFANRVFSAGAFFQARAQEIEEVASADVLGLVLVLHALLDDLLAAVEPRALERLAGREGLAADLLSARDAWHTAYARLFDPWLGALRELSRETGGDARVARLFREGARARALEETVNQLRNRAVRGFGHVVAGREAAPDAPRLWEVASRVAALLGEAGAAIDQAGLPPDGRAPSVADGADPLARRARELLAEGAIVDLEAVSRPGTTTYRPVARQVRRWIDASLRGPAAETRARGQAAFLECLRSLACLVEYVLADPRSFAAHAGHAVSVASAEDRAAWAAERAERGRDPVPLLPAARGEAGGSLPLDTLTGLRSKDWFLAELPGYVAGRRDRGEPLTFLMVDIDHFKWVNDELGHPRGDDVLKATAAGILDSVREGDLAVRYGGEEMLVVVPGELHTGLVLAERLRAGHEARVLGREENADVRAVGGRLGGACGSLSIGVAEVSGISDLTEAITAADRALYAAKRTRNTVVYADPSAAGKLSTWDDYRRQASAGAAQGRAPA